MPKFTTTEIVQFLDEPGHLLRIGTIDSDGYASVLPIWFIRNGDDILFTPRGPSVLPQRHTHGRPRRLQDSQPGLRPGTLNELSIPQSTHQ